jgi:hypothetical protein
MSDGRAQKIGGMILIGAAVLGVAAISYRPSATVHLPRAASAAQPAAVQPQTMRVSDLNEAVDRLAPAAGALPLPPHRIIITSPLDSAATDSARGSCVMRVREMLSEAARDSSEVEITGVTGVRPEPGRGPDSLVIEGTAHGRDATAAVWHCAVTAKSEGGISTLRAVVEDGWPGVPSQFDVAHTVTVAAEDACLERTKSVYREYAYRGVKYFRDADTLHVTGDAFPLNDGELVGKFHCRAVVRGGAVVDTIASAGK